MSDEENIESENNQPKNEPEGSEHSSPVNPESQKPEEPGTEEPNAEGQRTEEARSEVPENAEIKRLYRSKSNRILFGVCGGFGEYFGIDPLIIRILFVVSIFFGIWGVVVYLFALFIIPENPLQENIKLEERETLRKENSRIVFGSALILLGIFVLLKNTGIWYYNFFGIGREIFIPAILILLGIYLLIKFNSTSSPIPETQNIPGSKDREIKISNRKLYRSSTNKKIAGVCGGLGEYLNIDPALIRILWILFTFSSLGIGILIYIIFVIFIPENNSGIVNE